jgi:predicted HD superfamily hydrolase involved in NAD metabolism
MGEFSGILRQRVLSWLSDNVPESRIKHILRVEQMSIALAVQHALDVNKAAQAGLMHDLAKYFKPSKLLEMVRREGLVLDSVDEANPHLLHANGSAIVARDEFGVEDREILEAIADHTLGRPGMGAISCVVFLADSLEPGRGDTPELNLLRQTSQQNLQQAVWMTCDYSLKYLLESRRLIHPRAILTRNWFLQQTIVKQVTIKQAVIQQAESDSPAASLAPTTQTYP